MKIGIDIRALEGAQYGGVSEYIKNLLPSLFETGSRHTFHLLANAYRRTLDYGTLFDYPHVSVHRFHYPNKFFTFACRYLNRPLCDKLVGGVDVFFSPHFLPAPLSAECRRVTTFHDIAFEYFPEFFDVKRRLWHAYISPRHQAQRPGSIIAVSRSTRDDLVDSYALPLDKIQVVYSGLNKDILNQNISGWNRVKRIYKLPDRYILSLSTVEPRKNLIGLIRAFNVLAATNKSRGLALVIAGSYGWSYRSTLKEAGNSKYRDRIIFTGSIKDFDKAHIYQHAEIFIYPSRYEGFGFPPLEAMYCGVPTLVSGFTSLPEVVDDGALLIDPYRPVEMAQVMGEVLTDKRFSDYLSERGKKRAQQFSWRRTAQETLRVLEGN